MKTSIAPGTTWQVRLLWGRRQLSAAVVGGARRRLTVGNRAGDDWDTGQPGRVVLEAQADGALLLTFTAGVEGTVALHDDEPSPLNQLVARGLVTERDTEWTLRLVPTDAASLRLGPLTLTARRAPSRIRRIPLDLRALVGIMVALLAIGVTVASMFGPDDGPRLRWLKPRPPPPARSP